MNQVDSTKAFFEVFPTLRIEGETGSLMASSRVRKVRMSRNRDRFVIFLNSPNLIQKSTIMEVERELSRQLAPARNVSFRLSESFTLSSQYNPKTLFELYRESMALELKGVSVLLYNTFRYADITFEKGEDSGRWVTHVALPEDYLLPGEAERLVNYLFDIFNSRCGLKTEVVLDYVPAVERNPDGNEEVRLRLEQQLDAIRTVNGLGGMSGGNAGKGGSDGVGADGAGSGSGSDTAGSGAADGTGNAGDMNGRAGRGGKTGKGGKAGMAGSGSKADAGALKSEGGIGTGTGRGGTGPGAGTGMGAGALRGREGGKGGVSDRGQKRVRIDPSVIYGRDFDDNAITLDSLEGENQNIVIRGQLLSYEERQIRGERHVVSVDLTDYTDSITIKLFIADEELYEFRERIGAAGLEKGKKGMFVKVKGMTSMDTFLHELVVTGVRGIKKITPFITQRMDTALVKRTELHCHTNMSEQDGMNSVVDIMKRVDGWGWNSLAITDHGSLLAFPTAFHAVGGLTNKDFKLIYGLEAYLVDDTARICWDVNGGDGKQEHPLDGDFVVFDIETTGFSPIRNRIIEIGAVRVSKGQVTGSFDEFVNPQVPIPHRITELTSITDDMVSGADTIEAVLPRFLEFARDAVVVAHNAGFDTLFISRNAARLGLDFRCRVVDTVALARRMLENLSGYKLDKVARELGVSLENHHRAVDDATATGEIFIKLAGRLEGEGIASLEELSGMDVIDERGIKKLPTFHCTILVKNETGRVNLYRLVSDSHLKYYANRPRIPKSELKKYREGLIIGSACEAGELFQALEREVSEEDLSRIVDFYDYLEIQPIANNQHLLEDDNQYESVEDLQELNRQVVRLGEQFKKPVCATCDAHFLDPEDDIYRRIIMARRRFVDGERHNERLEPLYLRTTDEMLEEFAYLGDKKAYEVVVENPNLIADRVERINPVRPDKCPPVIEDSDKTLRESCYRRAHEIYGEELPSMVEERMETELKSIIGNGYAVMYVIAQKLVNKSNEDGYLVGSRGSVGSSFVAYLAGITEVNSLPPHYLCGNCHYYDFDSEEVKKFSYRGMCGCDMGDKKCPVCGEMLIKTGFDIPFETFLGFSGDKEPDIDLNFSGDYQPRAHKYTEVIFGEGQTFRAGTIGTMAEKTAYGFAKRYFEEMDIHKRGAEIERIAKGCEGVLRTTGQHPGGIVVLPHGEDIYSFTPLQHPADDMNTDIITTHFEYHSIDHNLLKLDILGHDDPTMIRFLQDMTGVDPISIPFDEKNVMSLFSGTEALGIKPEDIGGCPTGTLGVPEFGTDFVIQMLVDTKPDTFSDLIRISGLSHGTDVWTGNAQHLVNDMGLSLSDCICCRDDIMLYLIARGMDPSLSFKTMESVRKGKGLKDEMKEAMRAVEVPDWYIESCLKIKYMFPKAHAAAYVMMAWRVAWFKVYRPVAYYCGFFSIRASAIDYETMCQGRDRLEENLNKKLGELKEHGKRKMTATDLDSIKDMRLVQEMYARGIEFVPIELEKADGQFFRAVDDTHIMPPLSSVAKMGPKAADSLCEAMKQCKEEGDFLSIDDFKARTGCPDSIAAKLKELGILKGLSQSNQLSLFDLQEGF